LLGVAFARLGFIGQALIGQALIGLALIEPANAGGDGLGAAGTLDHRGIDEEIEAGVATASHLDDVVEDGTAGRGDHTDATGEGR
jgi:hypothetical protein